MALAFPAGPTGGQQYTGPDGVVYQWDSAVGVWIKVNSVQTVTSGATAATGAARIPTGNTAARPAATLAAGQFRYNSQIPQLEFSDGTAWLAAGGASAASLAEAQAGTINTKYSSPETSVPKDASGMTGAALVPGGTTIQRPGTPVTGMLRYNSTTLPAFMEFWDSAAWTAVGAGVAGLGINISVTGSIVKVSIPTVSTPPVAGALAAQAIDGSLYWDKELGSLFIRYNDGTRVQWVPSTGGTSSTGTLVFPDPATQTPVNTFSPGSTPIASTNGVTYTYNTTKGIWIGGGGALTAATLAEAKAGTLNTVFSSPQTAVPKDASGMTGAAILPSGTNAQRASIATPTVGMTRYNTTAATNNLEVYSSSTSPSSWRPIQYAEPAGSYPDLVVPALSTVTLAPTNTIYNNVTIAGTVIVEGAVKIIARGSVSISGVVSGDFSGSAGGPGGTTGGAGVLFTTGIAGRGLGSGTSSIATLVSELDATYNWVSLPQGSGGASGGCFSNNASSAAGSGGFSGSTFLVESEGPIVFSGSANLRGGNGANGSGTGTHAAGGGGGGSGGLLSLISKTSVSLGGTVNVSGGAGGVASGGGGPVGGSGGGGGGGWVVVQSPSVTVTAAITKTGGANGAAASGSTISVTPGGGGSFAGAGGQAGMAQGPDSAAGSGYLSNNGVLS